MKQIMEEYGNTVIATIFSATVIGIFAGVLSYVTAW